MPWTLGGSIVARGACEATPASPRLAAGSVHVWRAELDTAPESLVELLSEDERARAERMLRARQRQLWRRAHGVLRALLGRYLERDPRTLRFTAGPGGKPNLDREATARAIHFSMAHSGPLALYAFTELDGVGVDVELARGGARDVLGLARRLLGPVEARRLARLEPALRERVFLRSWVREEAELKLAGARVAPGARRAPRATPWTLELDVGPRACAALSLPRPPDELRLLGCGECHSERHVDRRQPGFARWLRC